MKQVLCALILFLFASCAHAAEISYVKVIAGCHTLGGKCVNIRSGPGRDHGVIRPVRIGTILAVDGITYRDGHPWYRVKHDNFLFYPERVKSDWYIAGDYTRMYAVGSEHLTKKSPATTKYIVVNVKAQTLNAYEGKKLFLSTRVSTGLKATPTPKGTFKIFKKLPSRYMQGPLPGMASKKEYDLPGVPWTMYFTQDGAAIHGTYWHSSFGTPFSHGCVNLSVDIAEKLYAWTPVGTKVIVK
jgi:hypothetical protein